MENKSHYIDGQWVAGSHFFYSVNPSTGDTVWEGNEANEALIAEAVSSAQGAFPKWCRKTFNERASYVTQFGKMVEARKDELTRLISVETGKPLWEAATEVSSVINKIAISIQAYQERTGERMLNYPDAKGYIRFKPHGVVAILGPFNFPAHLSNGHIVPALLAGNTIVYKPSELTPAVAEWMTDCWDESGLPAGVLNLIQGNAETAKKLLKQKIQGVFFTGSYRAGVQINQQFADKPEVIIALEMGGNNPLLIDKVRNRKAALYNTLLSTLITAGQRCTCARRLLIADNSDGDAFLEAFIKLCKNLIIGTPEDNPEPFFGPVIRYEHALNHLKSQNKLKKLGGKLLLEMRSLRENTGFLSPGIMDMTHVDNPPDEEIFAPFIQVYRYSDFIEALSLANRTKYGLAAGILTDSVQRSQDFFSNIQAGLINWNRPTTGAASNLPFGGVGHSGNHRPSAYFAADYCAYPIASLEQPQLKQASTILPGIPKELV